MSGRSKLHFQTTAFDHSFRIFAGCPATLPIARFTLSDHHEDDDEENDEEDVEDRERNR